jgi:hypothetical protein
MNSNQSKVIEKLKVSYPCQDTQLGNVTVKVLLCKDEANEKFFACTGAGDDEWLMNNGRLLKYNELSHFFNNYQVLKDHYITLDNDEQI